MSVNRNPGPGLHTEDIAGLHMIHGNDLLLAACNPHGGIRGNFQQFLYRRIGLAMCPGLQHLPEKDEGEDDGSRFKIHMDRSVLRPELRREKGGEQQAKEAEQPRHTGPNAN